MLKKYTPGFPDVGDLPLGVVSLARISPDGSSGPGKKCPMTPGTTPNSSYFAKVAVKSTPGFPDDEVLPLLAGYKHAEILQQN